MKSITMTNDDLEMFRRISAHTKFNLQCLWRNAQDHKEAVFWMDMLAGLEKLNEKIMQ